MDEADILKKTINVSDKQTLNNNKVSKATTTTATIKKEPGSNDDIKNFAENAMKELLSCWYGYDKTEKNNIVKSGHEIHSGCESSEPESSKYSDGGGNLACGWCGRILDSAPQVTSASGSFCSELCFSQSRRASFKRNKTCDWCRHIRHTVSYVDIQEGSRQLQFCSDKCLSQYKMHIFCRETRAHLQLHPHLEKMCSPGTSSEETPLLITPDMWLRDCRDSSPHSIATQVQTSGISNGFNASNIRQRQTSRRIHTQARRKSTRSSTLTSPEENSALAEGPQDLRVKPRDPDTYPLPSRTFPDAKSMYQPPPPHLWNQPLPPVTIMVPYPIIIPLPIPIPIPLPIGKIPVLKSVEDIRMSKALEVEEDIHDDDDESKYYATTRILRKRKKPSDVNDKACKKLSVS